MSRRILTLATRKSLLALAQSRAFARKLEALHPDIEVRELQVITSGDRLTEVPLWQLGGKGLFIKEIEEALQRKEADFAVHSFKDVPVEVPAGLVVGCVPMRADPRDALIGRAAPTLATLPQGATVGTSSLRRSLQIHRVRPDLRIVPLRGNVDTRLGKLHAGEMDAIVLAAAGLGRLGASEHITELLEPDLMIPAAAQGALAIECCSEDAAIRALLAPLQDEPTALAVSCERGVMAAVGGSCTVPFGAFAVVGSRGELRVQAILGAADSQCFARRSLSVAWPNTHEQARDHGLRLGQELLAELRLAIPLA